MLKHILVPLDQSDLSEAAIDYARNVISPTGLITFITVVDGQRGLERYDDQRRASIVKDMKESADAYLERIGDNLRSNGIRYAREVHTGRPADVIVDAASRLKVDAITMSTHGRSGLSRLRYGSVAQKVLQAAPCPVFIIPMRAVADEK